MLPAIRSELRKYATTRMWWGMGIGFLVTALLFSGLFGWFMLSMPEGRSGAGAPGTREFAMSVYTMGLQIAQILCLVIGVVTVGTEFRHRTATATFLATPRRWKVVLAKVVSVTLVCLLYGLVVLGVGLAIGAVLLGAKGYAAFPDAAFVWRTLGLCLLVLVVWGLMGLGIGTLIKNQVAALLIAVGFAWIVEPLLSLGLSAWEPTQGVAKFFPSMATSAVKAGSDMPEGMKTLEWWQGALVLVAYAAVMAVLGLVLTLRRDVS